MKTVALCLLYAVIFASNASAIIRPRFPHRPMPPFGGNSAIITDDSAHLSPSNPPVKARK